MTLNLRSIHEEHESRSENTRNLVSEKMLTQDHANELNDLSDGILVSLRRAFKMQDDYYILRAGYLDSDPATIAAEEQSQDNFFPSDTNDFFNS